MESNPSSRFDPQSLPRPDRPCRLFDGNPCEPCSKLGALEARLSEVRNPPESLIEEHRALRTDVNRSHNPIILQVPTEVASSIFEYCCPDADSERYKTKDAPLVLSAVSHEWRSIACSTPRIWTRLMVRLHSDVPCQPRIIEDWLTRSGALPLNIEVSGAGPWFNTKTNSFDNAELSINALNQFSHRWQDLTIESMPEHFLAYFRGNSASAPMLKSLKLHSWCDDEGNGKFALQHGIPMPVNVSLVNICFRSVAIVWEHVTSVQLDVRKMDDIISFFRHVPNMQKLKLDIHVYWEHTTLQPVPTMTHDKLQDLVINSRSTKWPIETFLQSFSFPALTKLNVTEFQSYGDHQTIPFSPFLSLFRRSFCRLRDLTLFISEYTNSDLISFLECVPSLERLVIVPSTRIYPDELFQRLADTSIGDTGIGGSSFLPHLRSLLFNAREMYHLDYFPKQPFPWNHLLRLFGPLSELGNPRRRPLQDVELIFDSGPETGIAFVIERETAVSLVKMWRAVLNAGLKLYLHLDHPAVDLLEDCNDKWDAGNKPPPGWMVRYTQ